MIFLIIIAATTVLIFFFLYLLKNLFLITTKNVGLKILVFIENTFLMVAHLLQKKNLNFMKKILSLILVAFGAANMWIAIFADVGVMILAVLNAIRALFVKKL